MTSKTLDKRTIVVDLEDNTSILDAMEAAGSMFLRMNEIRGKGGERRYVPSRITLDVEIPELTDSHRNLLLKADATGYLDGPLFVSPAEVFQFFTRSNIDMIWGENHLSDIDDDTFKVMASVVIISRRHCNF